MIPKHATPPNLSYGTLPAVAPAGDHAPLVEAAVKTAARAKLPKAAFAIPEKAPGSGSYPIHDEPHAKNALARCAGKPEEGRVKAAVYKRYPHLKNAK